jgi:uncharacterized protein YbjT (DUF2867 family)
MNDLVLVTGGTGYIGGRLIAALEAEGVPVRALARRPEALASRVGPATQVVRGDVLDEASLDAALAGVHTACYLVHSMGAAHDFAERDRQGAERFGRAARRAGVRRIVYLGGLGDPGESLSPHLLSRHETGDVLRASGVPVIEFRASIVIGTGSLSFDMVRALTERLPVMICPRWVAIKAQPIAVDDVLAYLRAALDRPEGEGAIYDIGGPDVVSYGDIMREYARQRGLRRLMIPVPLLTPRLSSLWLGLVTPLYARVGRKLISSLRNATVVRDTTALEVFAITPRSLSDAMARAIASADSPAGAARWSDSRSAADIAPVAVPPHGTVLTDARSLDVDVPARLAFAPIRRIGGERGWYADALWHLRAWVDLLAGGVGMRRGRRDPETVAVGDAIDFWRVIAYEPDRRLLLEAEMKVPGLARLEFRVDPIGDRRARIHQTARFVPSGLWGRLYWYALLPAHAVIFSGMIRAIARAALKDADVPVVDRPAPTMVL